MGTKETTFQCLELYPEQNKMIELLEVYHSVQRVSLQEFPKRVSSDQQSSAQSSSPVDSITFFHHWGSTAVSVAPYRAPVLMQTSVHFVQNLHFHPVHQWVSIWYLVKGGTVVQQVGMLPHRSSDLDSVLAIKSTGAIFVHFAYSPIDHVDLHPLISLIPKTFGLIDQFIRKNEKYRDWGCS